MYGYLQVRTPREDRNSVAARVLPQTIGRWRAFSLSAVLVDSFRCHSRTPIPLVASECLPTHPPGSTVLPMLGTTCREWHLFIPYELTPQLRPLPNTVTDSLIRIRSSLRTSTAPAVQCQDMGNTSVPGDR